MQFVRKMGLNISVPLFGLFIWDVVTILRLGIGSWIEFVKRLFAFLGRDKSEKEEGPRVQMNELRIVNFTDWTVYFGSIAGSGRKSFR